jgi:ATP/maltotriose-dependent transcriptional regulator MalT
MARSIALRCGAALEIRLESVEGAAQRVQALRRVVEAAMLAPPAGPTLWLRGWVAAHSGDPEGGLKLILEGHGLHMQRGMFVLCTEALLYATDAAILQGNFADARRYLTEGLEWARRLEEGLVLPELLLRQARIELAEGNAAAAEAAMRESVRVSRECGALNSELQGLVALVERPGRTEEDRGALAAAYGRITEGFDVKICCRARELLATPEA